MRGSLATTLTLYIIISIQCKNAVRIKKQDLKLVNLGVIEAGELQKLCKTCNIAQFIPKLEKNASYRVYISRLREKSVLSLY